jgi:hypothetical protein
MGATIKVATAVGAIGVFSWAAYAYNLKRSGSRLVIEPNLSYGISMEGLIVRSKPVIKNPTNTVFQINHPFIEVYGSNEVEVKEGNTSRTEYQKSSLIGSSNPENRQHTIIANGSTNINTIEITIRWRNVPALLKQALRGKIVLFVKSNVGVILDRLFGNVLPISDETKEEVNTTEAIGLINTIRNFLKI